MNQFQVQEEVHLQRQKIDPAIESEQKRRLAELRASRDNAKVSELRAQLENAARGTDNLMPHIRGLRRKRRDAGRSVQHAARRVWRVSRVGGNISVLSE